MSATGELLSLPLGRGVQVIKADPNGLVALAKPAGVLSHPNEPADEPRSLLTCPYRTDGEYFEWKGAASGAQRLYLLNRLDSATSGVILAALTEKLAKEIRALFQRRHIHKLYYALVFGVPSNAQQAWRDRLAVQKRGGQVRTQASGNIPAESTMRVIRSKRGDVPLALISLEPKTGRSHQLRVQCAKRHLPIVGDATYGDFAANRAFARTSGHKRLFLHSFETQFDYAWAGRTHSFSARADLPKEFDEVW
ncbi:RNA pseudouridine synthase [Opitutaceae bacterium EW11]|nr:RNA pseudouridine synthase [Opitutaceae bacterium EW11]